MDGVSSDTFTSRSDAKMIRWMCNIRPGNRISAEEFRIKLKLNSRVECLQDRTLQWLCHAERVKKSAWFSKCTIFKISGSFCRGPPRKTWNKVIRIDLSERTS